MIKRIFKGILESLKELRVVKNFIKTIVKTCIYEIVGIIYTIDWFLDRFYDFMAGFYKKINKRLQKAILYLILALAVFGVYREFKEPLINGVLFDKVEAKEPVEVLKNENKEVIEVVVEDIKKKDEIVVCNLDAVSCKIKEVADKYGIDYKLAIAISRWETGNYTSYAFTNRNNVGGLMFWNGTRSELQTFNSLDAGIEAFVTLLKYNYIDLGLDTIEEIQKKYAPVGVANDPNNLNSNWVRGVTNLYNQL